MGAAAGIRGGGGGGGGELRLEAEPEPGERAPRKWARECSRRAPKSVRECGRRARLCPGRASVSVSAGVVRMALLLNPPAARLLCVTR